eukprot:33363-Rhodomonas_salina.3
MPQLGVVVEGQGAGLEEADQLRVVGDPDGDEAVGVQQALHRKLSEVFERHRWIELACGRDTHDGHGGSMTMRGTLRPGKLTELCSRPAKMSPR